MMEKSMNRIITLLILVSSLTLLGCKESEQKLPETSPDATGGIAMEITVTSSAFQEGGMIPTQYTCDGADISPPLSWSTVPDGTMSLALICDDPDAPGGTWVHWVLYNLPPSTVGLPENLPASEVLESGARHGVTDFGSFGYGGPCPPSSTHRYFFKVYALDAMIKLPGEATKATVEAAMKGHILAEGELMGKYTRQ